MVNKKSARIKLIKIVELSRSIKMKILGFDHFQFIVKDFEESVEFFKKMGFKLVRQTEHHKGSAEFQIGPGGPIMELHASERNENPGHDHFAVLVEGLEEAVEDLKAKGVEVEGLLVGGLGAAESVEIETFTWDDEGLNAGVSGGQ